MASAADKLQAPKPTASVHQGKFKKLAQRVEETLTTEALYAEPKQLDPSVVLVSPLNRLGASPNVQHVHYGILKSFQKNAYGRTRPAIGICVEYRSEQGGQEALGAQPVVLSGQQAPATDLGRTVGPCMDPWPALV